MENCTEITVSIKSSESTFKKKFLSYENYSFNPNDDTIKACVAQTFAELKPIEDVSDLQVKVRCSMEYIL